MSNLYNITLTILAIVLNIIGTIYAVLSILKLTFKEVFSAITCGGIGERDKELLIQRKQAKLGISLILLGGSLQITLLFLNVKTCDVFFIVLSIFSTFIILVLILISKGNKKFDKEYELYKTERINKSKQISKTDN